MCSPISGSCVFLQTQKSGINIILKPDCWKSSTEADSRLQITEVRYNFPTMSHSVHLPHTIIRGGQWVYPIGNVGSPRPCPSPHVHLPRAPPHASGRTARQRESLTLANLAPCHQSTGNCGISNYPFNCLDPCASPEPSQALMWWVQSRACYIADLPWGRYIVFGSPPADRRKWFLVSSYTLRGPTDSFREN